MANDKQHKLNIKHAANPKPGDYWAEMLCGTCVITAVDEYVVTYCRKRKSCGATHWTWDLTTLESRTREEFIEWLQYGGNTEGYWIHVYPEAHTWVLSELKTCNSRVTPFVKMQAPKSKPATHKWATFEEWYTTAKISGNLLHHMKETWKAARK